MVAVFDAEWEYVLEAAKASKDLAGVRELLPELVEGVLDEPRCHSPGLLTEPATARMKGSHIPRVSGDEGCRR